MEQIEAEVLRLISSPTRLEMCQLIRMGVDHPDDLAKRLKVSRQSVDKHLLALHEMGVVERSAVFPTDGRPKIVYKVGGAAESLLSRIEQALNVYKLTMLSEFRDSMMALDDDLGLGRLDEQAYVKKKRELEKRYAQFLASEGKGD